MTCNSQFQETAHSIIQDSEAMFFEGHDLKLNLCKTMVNLDTKVLYCADKSFSVTNQFHKRKSSDLPINDFNAI